MCVMIKLYVKVLWRDWCRKFMIGVCPTHNWNQTLTRHPGGGAIRREKSAVAGETA